MSDMVTGLRQGIQDLITPEFKALSITLDAIRIRTETLRKQTEMQHDAVMKTLDAFRAEMRSEFASLRANNQVEVFRQVSPISERIAIVEARVKQG
jgi:propanediol dehydratase small subunit